MKQEVTQKVANELVTLFLNENIKSRTARAAETTDFLGKESDRLRTQIEVMEEPTRVKSSFVKGYTELNVRVHPKK